MYSVFIGNPFEMRLLNLRIIIFLLFFSLRFGQISPLAFFRWLTLTSDRNAESCNRIPSNCLSHHIFDQVNLWPAWVGIETAIFWQCSPRTASIRCAKVRKTTKKTTKMRTKKSAIKKKLIAFFLC